MAPRVCSAKDKGRSNKRCRGGAGLSTEQEVRKQTHGWPWAARWADEEAWQQKGAREALGPLAGVGGVRTRRSAT